MAKTYVVIPDVHVRPGDNQRRAVWLGNLIRDVKPDVVVQLGDAADMESLCSYDKGTKSFQGRTYHNDVAAHLEFQDRLWSVVRAAKKRLPLRVILEGNHEYRIKRATNLQSELEGTIDFKDLQFHSFYDVVVPYEGTTPGVVSLDGIHFAHYLVSGVSGRPISGEHLAYSLLAKQHASCIVGHNHTLDYCIRSTVSGRRIQAVCAGVCQEHNSSFAGEAQKLWWRGCLILRNVEDGNFDLQTVSLDALKKEYK